MHLVELGSLEDVTEIIENSDYANFRFNAGLIENNCDPPYIVYTVNPAKRSEVNMSGLTYYGVS